MNCFENNQDEYILLDSSINYLDTTAYVSLLFLNAEKLTLKSTDLLSVSNTLIYYLRNKQRIQIAINPISQNVIDKLQLLFNEAVNYERSHLILSNKGT